jgi:hypothetical protein
VAQVHYDLAVRVELDVGAVHRTRRGTFEIDSLGVVAAAMARALELVFAGNPVGRATEVGANRRDHEDALAVAYDPDSMLALELCVDAETEIAWVADLEPGIRLVKNPWEKKAKKHQEVHAQCTQHCRHHEPAAARTGQIHIGLLSPGKDGADAPKQPRHLEVARKPWISGRRATQGHQGDSEFELATFLFQSSSPVAAAVAATSKSVAATETAETMAATETAETMAAAETTEIVAAAEAAVCATETTPRSAECRSARSRRRRHRGPGLKPATLEAPHRALGSHTPIAKALRAGVRSELTTGLRSSHRAPIRRSMWAKRVTGGRHCAISGSRLEPRRQLPV